ncbi:APC family permease [Curtobacterium sp. VKM Ac-1376]|uniref:APC family permease n=1 Tax=Curtobacterium sp. VKM Ac-1376 TaxID=123312 RepID=UPI00188BCC8A|nr:APC family permease [Curtobacterium sp. VKM Ac-1376]MBF4615999.1 APC family permease [Curtobacterium sp. VKM Ac-1376]
MSTKTQPPTSTSPAHQDEHGLRLAANSIGFVRNLAQPIAVSGPTAGTAVMAAVMASVTRTPGPVSFALGIAAGALLVHVFVRLARRFESAGGSYFLAGVIAGVRTAVVVGLLYCFTLLLSSGGIAVNFGGLAANAANTLTGVDVPWPVFTALATVLATVLALGPVKWFTSVIAIIETLGFISLITLGVVVLTSAAMHGQDVWAAFSLTGYQPSQVFLGVVVAFSSFGGFEGGLVLSEETKNNKRVIPRGMWTALLLSGCTYTFASWFQFVGFGSVEKLAAQGVPMLTLATAHFGTVVAFLMNCTVMIAGLAAVSACLGGGARVAFAMIRDGLAPRSWAALSRRTHVPTKLVLFGTAMCLVAWVPLAFSGLDDATAFAYVTTTTAFGTTLIYLIVSAASIVWFARLREWGTTLVALLGAAVTGYTLFSSVYPFQPGTLGRLPVIAGCFLAAAVLFALLAGPLVRRVRASPYWVVAREERARVLAEVSTARD